MFEMFFAKIITRVLSTNLFVRLFFGIRPKKNNVEFQIGFSTIIMIKALNKHANKKSRILDIGTGPLAIHAVWLIKNIGCYVVATEINEAYIENAKKVAMINHVKLNIVKSDLFNNIKGNFDIAIFNPPISNKHIDNSYVTTGQFLKESPKLKILLAVNRFYVDFNKIENLIRYNKYKITDVVTSFLNPARVYAIEKI